MFADDTNIFLSHRNHLFQIANRELENIHEWFKQGTLKIFLKFLGLKHINFH